MEWIEKNIALCMLLVFILLVIILLIGILTFIKSKKIYRQNNESQVVMKADIELSTSTSNVTLNINLYNSSFKDVTLSQLGFIYKNQKIDFYQEACEILKQDKIVIETRNHVNFKMNIERFEEMLKIIAYKDKKIYSIRSFVTDIIGIEKVTKSKSLTKVLQSRQNERFAAIKEQNKEMTAFKAENQEKNKKK